MMHAPSLLPVVAIDGPVGVGKSSVAEAVAKGLHLRHINTGSMYRAVALLTMEAEAATGALLDDAEVATLARSLTMEFTTDGQFLVNGRNYGEKLRHEDVSRYVARIADNHEVREALVTQQRRIGSHAPSVLEGRDIGTVVFPDAACKVYLDAAPHERVARRIAQLRASGNRVDEEAVRAALVARDAADRSRPWGALRLAEDAVLIDTTCLAMERVVAIIIALVRENRNFPLKSHD